MTETPPTETSRTPPRYTLYLVQSDAAHRTNGRPTLVALIGRVVCDERGAKFLPNTTSHKASRKFHASATKAIPAWADKLAARRGFAELLGCKEYHALRALKETTP